MTTNNIFMRFWKMESLSSMEINKDFLDKWIEALLSGKYKQGRFALRNGDEFCCLGVACDLISPSSWDGNMWNDEDKALPDDLEEQINALLPKGVDTIYLANLNDCGRSFEYIARVIKEGKQEE